MRLRRVRQLLILIFVSLIGVFAALAEDPKWYEGVRHRLSVELRPAYNIVSHYALRNGGDPADASLSLHARYAFSANPESRLGRLFPSAYQGIGIAAYSYFHHSLTGTPVAIYIFQGARIADFNKRASIGYEWNLGYSFGWHPNEAMSSRGNILINIGVPIVWRVTDKWELTLTPDFTHFSNGDTSFSNAGSNLFGARIGATYHFDADCVPISARRFIARSEEFDGGARRMSYDIVAYGAWRADRFIDDGSIYVVDKALPIAGLHFQPLYNLNNYFAIGGSLDLQIDSSLNLYNGVKDDEGNTIAYSRPPLWQQMEAGVSLRGEIRAPIFSLGVGVGYNLVDSGYDTSRLYTTFSLKAHLTRRLMLYIGYRLNSQQYTHNLMYGLGVRL
ncbi:MAG: acyloxyacyl hydrolase [Alistipes sp.]|nr:acyloxyacyl hydrolase [Alistipes sp.]